MTSIIMPIADCTVQKYDLQKTYMLFKSLLGFTLS